jgi:hypothetical protein
MTRLTQFAFVALPALAVMGAGIVWGAPIALSIYAARTAPPVVRVTPEPLHDLSINQRPGGKLSYFGYEFEVPWSDLDAGQTKLYPREKPSRVVLTFRSGLRLMVTDLPAGEWMRNLSTNFKVSPDDIRRAYGSEATSSDYAFAKMLYNFTPDKMDLWSLSSSVHSRNNMVLIIKSLVLSSEANSGIFAIQNQADRGFQEGSPTARVDRYMFTLYSDSDSVEFILSQKNYKNPEGVTQPEINRIVQSLRRISAVQDSTPPSASKSR